MLNNVRLSKDSNVFMDITILIDYLDDPEMKQKLDGLNQGFYNF